MNFSEARPQRLIDIPALQHKFVQVSMAISGTGKGGGRLVCEGGQHLGVSQLVIGSDPGKVENLPETHAERPDVGLGGVAVLKDLYD